MKHFDLHILQLQKGDTIYSWTDGVTDQLGGVKGRKLKVQGLKEFLTSIMDIELPQQRTRIEEFLIRWRTGEEQLDDISFTAVRI